MGGGAGSGGGGGGCGAMGWLNFEWRKKNSIINPLWIHFHSSHFSSPFHCQFNSNSYSPISSLYKNLFIYFIFHFQFHCPIILLPFPASSYPSASIFSSSFSLLPSDSFGCWCIFFWSGKSNTNIVWRRRRNKMEIKLKAETDYSFLEIFSSSLSFLFFLLFARQIMIEGRGMCDSNLRIIAIIFNIEWNKIK